MRGGGILIIIESISATEVNQFAPILQSFLQSYANKSEDMKIEDWLTFELQNHLSDKSAEEIQSITADIIQGVDSFNHNLHELNEVCNNGTTKEAWFANQLKLTYENGDIDIQTFGHHLFQMQLSLFHNNKSIIEAMTTQNCYVAAPPYEYEDIDKIRVDKLDISTLSLLIAKQSSLSGVANATLDYGFNLAFNAENINQIENAEIVYNAFTSVKDEEVKKAASAAMIVAKEQGILPSIPENIPQYLQTRTLAGITSLGIENTKIFSSFADGTISSLETLECLSRNTISLFASISCEKIGAGIGASLFSFVPVIGTTLGTVVGSLVGRMVDNKITQTVKNGVEKVKSVATAVARTTWNVVTSTVKSAVSTVYSGIKSIGKTVLSLFGF